MPKKILLVEDEALIAMNEAQMLKKHGYEVVAVYNGETAVETVDADPDISLILMDIDLGKGIDGTEAAERILATHDLPIAFLSSHTEPEVVEKTEGITSYGYIVKNSGETVLLASIKMAFRLYDAHLELKAQKRNLNNALTKYEQTAEELNEREGMLRNLMENSIDAVYLLNEEGRFLDINKKACEMTGYTREELLSRRIADIDPNLPAEAFYRFWKEKPKGASLLFETIHIHKNGKPIPVEMNGIFFELNKKKYIFGVARDLTERKRAEDRLRASEATVRKRLEVILEPDGDIGVLKLADIIDYEALQTMMEDFYKISGIGCAINDISGKILVSVGWQDICTKFHRLHPDTLENCLTSDVMLSRGVPVGTFKAYLCKNNMWDIVTPIMVGGKHLGNIFLGQFFYEDEVPDYELFRKQARQYGFDETEYLAALDRVPRFNRETVDRTMAFYSRLANMISLLSYTTIKLSRNMVRHQQKEEALKRSEENLRITLNSIGDAVISTDIDGAVIQMNPVAEGLCGWSIDEAKGIDLKEVFHIVRTDTMEKVENPVSRVLKTGNIIGLANHTMLISRDGSKYQIADSASPIKDDEGNINGVVLVFRDVTEEYEKDRQLQERIKELDCLYKIAEIVEKPNIALDDILQQSAEAIPPSWQYPELCECRITLHGDNYQTKTFSDTKRKLESDIIVGGVVSGKVEVSYLNERPTIVEAPFLEEEQRLIDAVAERLGRIIERRQGEEKLRSIEWMLSNKSSREGDYIPEYGDVSELNKDGIILTSVGKEHLKDIASEYLDLLETSTAIYEKNGDYALGIFTSGWCQLMDAASRRLCPTKDNQEAIESGKWLCHESCWKDALLSMNEGQPVEIKCDGGINMYAAPIWSNDKVVGAMNFGYGNPPTDETELKRLSDKYNIPICELKKQAEAYKPRPQFIVDYAKERIQTAAKTLGYLIERRQTEKALQREDFFLSSVLDTIKEAVIICNEKGEITRFNESARKLHNVPEKRIPPEQWAEYYDLYYTDGHTLLDIENIPLFRALQGEDVINVEIIVKPKKGTAVLLSCSGQQIKDEKGNKKGAVIAMHDITELKKSKDRYKRLIHNSPNMIMETDVDSHEIISCNPAMARNLGTKIPEIVGKKIDDFVPFHILKRRLEISHKAIETGEVQILEDERNGKYFHNTYIPIVNEGRRIIQTITSDFTEWKKSENKLQKQKEEYELIFNNSLNGILFTSPDGKIYSANPAACEILEASEEVILKHGRESVVDATDPRLPKALEEREKKGKFQGELRFRRGTGVVFPVEINTQIFKNPDGEVRSSIFFQDITERKQQEEKIQKALKEKDFLMRELNHRVKNNLAMVSSLISLKESEIGNDLSDLKNRIDVIKLVHEKLHQQNDIGQIWVKEYFQDILESVFYSTSRWTVHIINNVEDVSIPSKNAITLGLVVNEIATNAAKYGFTENKEARFSVDMKRDSDSKPYILTLSNTGNPFPEEIGLENPETMGLQLVSSLVDQLHGTIELQKKPNPVFTLRFPARPTHPGQ